MVSALVGSKRVMALNCKSVFAGHCALISATAFLISSPVIGASGWSACDLDRRSGSEDDTASVDMMDVRGMGKKKNWSSLERGQGRDDWSLGRGM